MKKGRRKSAFGRKASDADREFARSLAALVRAASESPDHEVCVNPEDPWEERTYWELNHNELARILESFADEGRFVLGEDLQWRATIMRMEFAQLRRQGILYADAGAHLADKYELHKNHISKIVAKKPKVNRSGEEPATICAIEDEEDRGLRLLDSAVAKWARS